MINLLPPPIKEQIGFAKRNAIVRRYLWWAVVTLLTFGAVFGATTIYLHRRLAVVDQEVRQQQARIAAYSQLQNQVKSLDSRVKSINKIQTGQAKFSSLLNDLARSMPPGAALTAVNLDGDDKKPVSISAVADSYNAAVGLRDTLAGSSRVAAADIQSVSQTGGSYRIDIIVSFKPGKAK